ncbi:hypothetical protein ACS0TY_019184 [Phlomoides rotata]
MKILSINARGTNSLRKRRAIKAIIKEVKPDFVCIQETKKDIISESFCGSFWPDKEFEWSYYGSKGASGGLLTIWRKLSFSLISQWGSDGALALKGKWIAEDVYINLVNIYAPIDVKEQYKLWEEVLGWIQPQISDLWCICGDFNATLHQSERKGRSRFFNSRRCSQFRKLIEEAELVDLPLLRRKYTWYKDNGESCSRIDRFLLSSSCHNRWNQSKQYGLKRTFSDHAPILLDISQKENWGPIPFKMINWWIDIESFRNLVSNFWRNTSVEGWGGFVLKEKMKMLKLEIKNWKRGYGTNFSKEIEEAEMKLANLDSKLEQEEWSAEDKEIRRNTLVALEDFLLKRDRVAIQKSRSRWLKEGDANTSFFHHIVKRHSKAHEINSVKIKEARLEGVHQVKEGIFQYFKDFFSDHSSIDVRIRGIECSSLNEFENLSLIKEFSLEEASRTSLGNRAAGLSEKNGLNPAPLSHSQI